MNTANCIGESNSLSQNTFIIFDWDDTLYPKSEICKIIKNNHQTSEEQILKLSILSNLIYGLLNKYIKQYSSDNIVIVTASCNNWIKYSLKYLYQIGKFKQIYHLLFGSNEGQNKIKIYHPDYPLTSKQAFKWKHETFKKLYIDSYISSSSTINTFCSIGDGEFEFKAAISAKKCIKNDENNLFVHRIKLSRNPSFNNMINQFSLLSNLCGIFEKISIDSRVEETIDYQQEKLRLVCNKN